MVKMRSLHVILDPLSMITLEAIRADGVVE